MLQAVVPCQETKLLARDLSQPTRESSPGMGDRQESNTDNHTLLEMSNLNSSNNVSAVEDKVKVQGETNRLTLPDRSPDEEDVSGLDLDLSDSDSYSSSEEDEASHILDPESCKGKIATMMKSNVMQYCVISMVIADCLIIVLELLIDMDFIVFPEDQHQAAANHHTSGHHSDSQPANLSSHPHSLYDVTGDYNLTLDNSSHQNNVTFAAHASRHHSNKEKAEHVLHALSLTILSLFMIEVSLKIYVEGKHLLRQKAEVFDAVVVIVSFTLDIVFSFVSVESAAKDAAGLMVILRLWRVTRIINGVILSVKIEAKKKTTALKKIIRQLEHDNRRQKTRIEKLERENSVLRHQLTEHNDGTPGLLPHKVSHHLHRHHHHPQTEGHSHTPHLPPDNHNNNHQDSSPELQKLIHRQIHKS